MQSDLRAALHRNEIQPFYQTQVDLRSGRVVGVELLARWLRDGIHCYAPDEFIPAAEEYGLLNELLIRLLGSACNDAKRWSPGVGLSVNISPLQLQDPEIGPKLIRLLKEQGFPPHGLTVEITEGGAVCDCPATRSTIALFKSHGIAVALDDFGTRFSSLHLVRSLPVDQIKIDRSFVAAVDHDPAARAIISAIVTLARDLHLSVVAEGIEDAATAASLRELGCDQGQGFHFGRPVPAAQLDLPGGELGSAVWAVLDHWRQEARLGRGAKDVPRSPVLRPFKSIGLVA